MGLNSGTDPNPWFGVSFQLLSACLAVASAQFAQNSFSGASAGGAVSVEAAPAAFDQAVVVGGAGGFSSVS